MRKRERGRVERKGERGERGRERAWGAISLGHKPKNPFEKKIFFSIPSQIFLSFLKFV